MSVNKSYIRIKDNYIYYGISDYSLYNYNGKSATSILEKGKGWYETLMTAFISTRKDEFLIEMQNLYKVV